MMKRIVFTILIFHLIVGGGAASSVQGSTPQESKLPGGAAAANRPKVEVFDVIQGRVVKYIDNSLEIQEEVRLWLGSISGLSPQLRVDPEDGIAVKIAINPPISIERNEYSGFITEVFLCVPRNRTPYLLVFTEDGKPLVFLFEHDIAPFLREHGLMELVGN
jgi:hypothetical protein